MFEQVLVTHHVALMLPAAYHLIHLSDGKIDLQGHVEDLRQEGVLETVVQEEQSSLSKDNLAETGEIRKTEQSDQKAVEEVPKTLAEKEHRETEGVSWVVYKTYLRAAYVMFVIARLCIFSLVFDRSYWTWIFITCFVASRHATDIAKKLWMKVSGISFLSRIIFVHLLGRYGAKRSESSYPAVT